MNDVEHTITAGQLAEWAAKRMLLTANVAADLVACNPNLGSAALARMLHERLQTIQTTRVSMYCLLLDMQPGDDRSALAAERQRVELAGQHAAHLVTGLIAGLAADAAPV